ncbi:hypothetical protein BV25DRAFT_166386 [Artomyces pyxidatus]|uniref:Uncharacterized protein n=1 Tax=Artomyces pyxidatus TaxID=48021 RepID=A0ACB8SG68_9AGAM|nr:hypothetical protein BV25DRAFT_166386 [Artomyces pyxidatus]
MDPTMLDGRQRMEAENDRSDSSGSTVPSYWSACGSARLAILETMLSGTDTEGIDGSYRRLDAEISDLACVLSWVRMRRNRLSPISHLPPEILVHIFSFDTTPNDGSPTYHLMHITHVCRRWRSVAIGCPSLWGRINLGVDHRWKKVMLARAKAVPLSILLERPQDKMTEDDIALVVQHFPRIRNLHLLNRMKDDVALTSKLHERLTTPAPLLESFCLGIRYANHEEWPTLPQNIFSGHAPRLRQLTVENFAYFPWQSPVLSGLVHLCISSPSLPLPFQSHPLDKILDAFERMPALRLVHLLSCLPPASDRDCTHVVDLTQLTYFGLIDDINASTQFLRSIRLHTETSLNVGVQCSEAHGDDSIDAFLSVVMAKHYASHFTFPRLQFLTEREANFLVHTMIKANSEMPTAYQEEDDAPFILNFWLDYGLPKYGNPQAVSGAFCAMLPNNMDYVRCLDVHGTDMAWTVDEWMNILRKAENLTALRASDESADTVCHALTTAVDWNRETGASVFMCPKLSSLTLSYIRLKPPSHPGDPVPFAFRLPQSLEKRRRSCLQLEHLHLVRCYGGTGQVRTDLEVALRRLVGSLTVTAPPRDDT